MVERPIALLKYAKEQHISSVIEGKLYLNSLRFYQEHYEGAPDGQIDSDEGLKAQYQPQYIKIAHNGIHIGEVLSPVKVRQELPAIFTFCSSAITKHDVAEGYRPSERLREFGSKIVFITDFDEFLRRVSLAVNTSYESVIYSVPGLNGKITGMVEYVQSDHHGEMGVFTKFDKFEYQREWRIAFVAEGVDKDYFILDIGDLSDITLVTNANGELAFQPF